MELNTFVSVLVFILGLPAAVATIVVFFRTASLKGRMDLLESENSRIRSEAGDLRDQAAHLMSTLDFREREWEMREKEYEDRVARLEENINILQGDLLKEFLQAVRAAMVDAFNEVVHSGDRRKS